MNKVGELDLRQQGLLTDTAIFLYNFGLKIRINVSKHIISRQFS